MILSLDCSTTAIGWSVFDGDILINYGRLVPTIEDLEWRDRVHNLLPQVENLILKYQPTEIYQEQVPNGGKGGNYVLSQLFYLQGVLSVVEVIYSNLIYIEVGTWRKNIGINNGKDQRRNIKKINSVKKANELFGLNLPIEYTVSGNYRENGSDDISDSILLYASTRKKYKIKNKSFGRGE